MFAARPLIGRQDLTVSPGRNLHKAASDWTNWTINIPQVEIFVFLLSETQTDEKETQRTFKIKAP